MAGVVLFLHCSHTLKLLLSVAFERARHTGSDAENAIVNSLKDYKERCGFRSSLTLMASENIADRSSAQADLDSVLEYLQKLRSSALQKQRRLLEVPAAIMLVAHHNPDRRAHRDVGSSWRQDALDLLQHLQHPEPRGCSHRKGWHFARVCVEGSDLARI